MEYGGEGALSKEEIAFLNQLVASMEQAFLRLQESHEKKDYDGFTNSKRLINSISKKISEIL